MGGKCAIKVQAVQIEKVGLNSGEEGCSNFFVRSGGIYKYNRQCRKPCNFKHTVQAKFPVRAYTLCSQFCILQDHVNTGFFALLICSEAKVSPPGLWGIGSGGGDEEEERRNIYCALHPSCFVVLHSAFLATLGFLYLALYISSPTHPLQVFVVCRQRAFGVQVLLAF